MKEITETELPIKHAADAANTTNNVRHANNSMDAKPSATQDVIMQDSSSRASSPQVSTSQDVLKHDERIEHSFVGEAHSTTERQGLSGSESLRAWIIVAAIAAVAFAAVLLLWTRNASSTDQAATKEGVPKAAEASSAADEHAGEHGTAEAAEVRLAPEVLASAGFEYEGVTQRPAIGLLRVTGSVEANPQGTQQVTPLVGGRVDMVTAKVGDRVSKGDLLAVIASPQIAQMHGKLHEARTAYELAERNLTRVRRAENRVAVLSAKARLDEAEATLRRTRKLVELGAGAGKDLIAAETAYKTARAEYDFQNNISLNRELQEARASVETARVDVAHIEDELRALGAPVPTGEDDHRRNTSLVAVRAPASGIVTERTINAGAGIEAGRSLFTISNLSIVFVIANIPEAGIAAVRIGTIAEITAAALNSNVIRARVSYLDPQLDEATRTARARIEISNPGERLRAGMFVEVGFQTATNQATGDEIVVASSAVQQVENRTIVFVPKDDEPGAFEIREIETGGETENYTRVVSGVKVNEKVVTKGSFTLKTQMQKGEMGDHDH